MQYETKKKLNELIADSGHVLHVDDLDDVLELDQLAAKVSDPQNGIDSPLTHHAVYVRGVPVYPLTLAHLSFLDECPASLGMDDQDRSLAMLWIVTQEEIKDEFYNPDQTRKAIRKWARHCRWTQSDIEGVMELRYSRLAKQADGAGDKNSDGALVGMLSREYGESPSYWMHTAPLGVIEACVADWTSRQEAQAAAYRRANKGAGVAPAPSPKFVAMRKFRECAERIRAKWLAKNHL